MKRIAFVWFFFLGLPGLLFLPQATGWVETLNENSRQLSLAIEDDRLSLTARQVPLKDLLKEISRKSHYAFTGEGAQSAEPRTLKISGLPLDRAIQQILEDYSFITIHQETQTSSDKSQASPSVQIVIPAKSSDAFMEAGGSATPNHFPQKPGTSLRNRPVVRPPFSPRKLQELKDRQVDLE